MDHDGDKNTSFNAVIMWLQHIIIIVDISDLFNRVALDIDSSVMLRRWESVICVIWDLSVLIITRSLKVEQSSVSVDTLGTANRLAFVSMATNFITYIDSWDRQYIWWHISWHNNKSNSLYLQNIPLISCCPLILKL